MDFWDGVDYWVGGTGGSAAITYANPYANQVTYTNDTDHVFVRVVIKEYPVIPPPTEIEAAALEKTRLAAARKIATRFGWLERNLVRPGKRFLREVWRPPRAQTKVPAKSGIPIPSSQGGPIRQILVESRVLHRPILINRKMSKLSPQQNGLLGAYAMGRRPSRKKLEEMADTLLERPGVNYRYMERPALPESKLTERFKNEHPSSGQLPHYYSSWNPRTGIQQRVDQDAGRKKTRKMRRPKEA